jgi:hypothetical protein
MKVILTESQLKMLNESLHNDHDILNEAWWNTLGDIVGIFDPTGIVDLVNGADYIRQGDTFFGMLSIISALPYFGDLVAKPLLMAGKGSKLIKTANDAIKLAKAGNEAKAIAMLKNVSNSSSITRKLFGTYRTWAPKLKELISKIPGGKLSAPLKQTVNDAIDLFGKVGGGTQKASSMIRRAAMKPMTKQETINLAKQVKKAVEQDGKLFRSYGGQTTKGLKGIANWKLGGVPRIMGNRAVRSLMSRTKFWAGFLDYIGLGNFVGPDEYINKVGQDAYNESMDNYVRTPEAQKNWGDDFSTTEDTESSQSPRSTTPTNKTTVSQDILSDLLFGPLQPIVS